MLLRVIIACSNALLNGAASPPSFIVPDAASAKTTFQQIVVNHPEIYPAGCTFTTTDIAAERAAAQQLILALDAKLQAGTATTADVAAAVKVLVRYMKDQIN